VSIRRRSSAAIDAIFRDILRYSILGVLLLGIAHAAPVDFTVDTSRAPELELWAQNAAQRWQAAYPLICAELASPGYEPPRVIRVTVENYDGIAETSISGIRLSSTFIRENPEDVDGAMVHEIAHVVQGYGLHWAPGWLTEGIADYVRFFRWSTGELGHIQPDRSHYNGSYRITASFLNFLVTRYDPEIVRKLNRALREGSYRERLFQTLTGKTAPVLGEEWRATLPRTPADLAADAMTDNEDSTGIWWSLLGGGAIGGVVACGILWWRRRSTRRVP
jgi:hypothetical protein